MLLKVKEETPTFCPCDFVSGNTGVAVVKFSNHYHARDVSRLFETNGIGKNAWNAQRLFLTSQEEPQICGWLAEAQDMNQLPNYRKKWTMAPLENVQDDCHEAIKRNEIIRKG